MIMPDSPEVTNSVPQYIMRCLKCGKHIPGQAVRCPQCGTAIAPGTVEIESNINTPLVQANKAVAFTEPEKRQTSSLFPPDASALFRVIPWGTSFAVKVDQPLILGRSADGSDQLLFDLTDYRGQEHGVSRQHCELVRRGTKLYVSDLRSTNGTFLNGKQLPPHQEHKLSHGDRLVLGTLQMLVLFTNLISTTPGAV